MRDRVVIAAFVMLASATASADARVHVVAAGESLERLARRYGTSVDVLRDVNGLESDRIRVGQELTIDPGEAIRYTTVPGDTLGCIAERYGVSLDRVRADNPGLSGRLVVGRTLVLRGARDPRADEVDRVTVREGETLSAIAARVGVPIADILAANPGLDPDRVEAGREIVVPRATALRHRVRAGESLARIARRYGVSLDQLATWNPRVDARRLPIGTELIVRPGADSASVGSPTCGWIRGAVQLPRHSGYLLRDPARAWATARTASRITAAFDALARAHPRGPRVRVHDLSLRGGGPIDDHRSHESGRDVDITYVQRRGCGASGCPLRAVGTGELDARRQWALLSRWLRRDEAEAVFIDYELQAPLYREAERRGATREQLERWFQYPRGRSHDGGVIRHFPNHRDHLHVRFVCEASEPSCR